MPLAAFTVDSKELAPALVVALTALDAKERIPVLSSVLVEADGQTATATITGASTSHSLAVKVDAIGGDEPFAACIERQKLLSLVRQYDGLVTLRQHDPRWITVTSDNSRHRLPSEPRESFIMLEQANSEIATVSGPLLSAMLTAASIAAETNPFGESRWKALEWRAGGGKLTITGCNGPQLSTVEIGCDAEFYALVPESSVRLIAGIAAKADTVTLYASERLFTAVGGNATVTTQLAAAAWPDWQVLLGGEREHIVDVDAASLAVAMRRALLADNPETPRLKLEFTADTLTLTCASQRGESRESVAIRGNGTATTDILGEPMLKFLKLARGDVRWELGAPMRLTVGGEFSWRYLQLPLVEIK